MSWRKHFKSSCDYEFIKQIGSGGSSDVLLYERKVWGLPPQDIVLKVLKNYTAEDTQELINEGRRLSILRHPHIVKTFGYEAIQPDRFGLLLEYIPGCPLSKIIEDISPKDRECVAIHIIKTVLEALDYAHSIGVIHGDISSRNILVSVEGHIKVSDFGLVVKDKGSPDYMAPERWQEQAPNQKSDVFSLGILALELLLGENLLKARNFVEAQEKLQFLVKNWPQKIEGFSQWKSFFELCLHSNPSRRGSCHELIEEIPEQTMNSIGLRKEIGGYVSQKIAFTPHFAATKTMGLKKRPLLTVANFYLSFLIGFIFLVIPCLGFKSAHPLNRLKPFSLSITSNPWSEVFLNNRSLGYTPIMNHRVAEGSYILYIKDGSGRKMRRYMRAYGNGILFLRVERGHISSYK